MSEINYTHESGRQLVISTLCEIREKTWNALDPSSHRQCDCVCELGIASQDPNWEFRSTDTELNFIRQAVAEKLEREGFDVPEALKGNEIEETNMRTRKLRAGPVKDLSERSTYEGIEGSDYAEAGYRQAIEQASQLVRDRGYPHPAVIIAELTPERGLYEPEPDLAVELYAEMVGCPVSQVEYLSLSDSTIARIRAALKRRGIEG